MLVNKEVVHPVLLIVLHLAASKNECFVSKPFKVKTFKPMSFAIQSCYTVTHRVSFLPCCKVKKQFISLTGN